MLRKLIAAFVAAGVTLVATAHSQQQKATSEAPAANAVNQGVLIDGEVRKVDSEAKKLTLRHGPIPNLEMSAMTMVFRVADPSMLQRVKTGDTVRFTADRVGGELTVTRIEQRQ